MSYNPLYPGRHLGGSMVQLLAQAYLDIEAEGVDWGALSAYQGAHQPLVPVPPMRYAPGACTHGAKWLGKRVRGR